MTSFSRARQWIPKDLGDYCSWLDDDRPGPGSRGPRQTAVPTIQEAIVERARTQLERATQAAQQLLEQGEALADRARREAVAEGYALGREQGLNEGRREAEQVKESALCMMEQAREIRDMAAGRAKEQVLELATILAERIVRRQLFLEPDMVRAMVDEALSAIPEGAEILVRAHASSIVVLRDMQDSSGSGRSAAYHLTYMADGDMEPGDFLFDTIYGQLDGRLEIQLERMADAARDHILTEDVTDGDG